jgi:hypothetical protein
MSRCNAALYFVIPNEAEGSAVSLSGAAAVPGANLLQLPFLHQQKLQIPPLRYASVGMTK